jgi:putative spermidine/putrescine transport system substrate-binding protein
MRRRAVIAGVAAAPLAMPLIRRARAAGGLTVGLFGDIFRETYEPAIVEPFRRQRRDLNFYYYEMSSSFEGLNLLRTQRMLPQIDIIMLDAMAAAMATAEGLVEPVPRTLLPWLPDTAFMKDIAGPAVLYDNLVMLFLPGQVRSEPDSWKVLWDGVLQRKVAINGPPDITGLAFILIANRIFGGGDYHATIENGLNAISQMAPNIRTWDPRPDIYNYMIDGPVIYGVGWNTLGQAKAARSQGRLAVALPEEGGILRPMTLNLVKGSENHDAATDFLMHAASPEAQRICGDEMYFTPASPSVRLAPTSLPRTVAIPARLERMMQVDWPALVGMRNAMTAQWRDKIIRRL